MAGRAGAWLDVQGLLSSRAEPFSKGAFGSGRLATSPGLIRFVSQFTPATAMDAQLAAAL